MQKIEKRKYKKVQRKVQPGAEPPPASLGTSPDSASTLFVASSTITRTSRFSCGFCQGFRFPDKCNTLVGNCFLRILGSAGKVYRQEICNYPLKGSNIIWEVYKIIRKKYAIIVWAL